MAAVNSLDADPRMSRDNYLVNVFVYSVVFYVCYAVF